MLLFLFLFGLALGAVSPSDDQQVNLQRGHCPTSWYDFYGRCYKYVSTQMTWADAELHCVSEGANLVSINSLEEYNFINALIRNFDPADKLTWIGLSDTQKEGGWMWSDGSAVKVFFWNPGEPNNAGGEHCVHNNRDTNNTSNDHQCSNTFPFVCASRRICP
ncbi:lactose-binding lectin l-2-like [Centropristis striata]|uniref:lactose-binding lectin l-2-like n=1 Tax=Centropristis striata TaxID=184440 RepID=UPI0027E0756C|nr:lactose-binding lectin l-2-like [Centropristis striata]